MNNLYKYNDLPFTKLYILIWSTFMMIHLLDITQLCSQVYIHSLYNIADTLCKYICTVVVSNHNEKELSCQSFFLCHA